MFPVTTAAIAFLRARWWTILLLSLVLLIPCFWHPHIEAGDLASHVYNAWLTNLVQRGQAPDLYLAPQTNNILADVLLAWFGGRFGYVFAERAVSVVCVLLFFWGAFALMAAVAKRAPWQLVPALALAAYGYTFEMGFFNYYLSIGFSLWALAIAYGGSKIEWPAIVPLVVLAWIAHPVGCMMLVATVLYVLLSRYLKRSWRVSLFIAALLAVVAAHVYVMRFTTDLWSPWTFAARYGGDQFMIYGKKYGVPYVAFSLVLISALGYEAYRDDFKKLWRRGRIVLELWLVLLFFGAMIPQIIFLPQYPAAAAYIVSRTTSMSLVFILSVLALARPAWWHAAGFGTCALLFFVLLYRDTGRLNILEDKAALLVRGLPRGARVIATFGPPSGSRVHNLEHVVDRACIQHCFSYDNYEPATLQFRLRVHPNASIVISSADDAAAMSAGKYLVKAQDLPAYEIYQQSNKTLDDLKVKTLKAGTKNCEHCPSPIQLLPWSF